MNDLALAFLAINGAALVAVPRRWAALPLLACALYMTLGPGVEVGPFSFPVFRLLLAVGMLRVLVRGELSELRLNSLDKMLLVWAAWAIIASLFYSDGSVLVNRLGMVYNACGIYFLLRALCRSADEAVWLCRLTAFLIAPVAATMVVEAQTGRNLFSVLGGVETYSEVRGTAVRAQGPFAHSILAGSVGAACLPLVAALWNRHRYASTLGSISCVTMVLASGSSGPVLSTLMALGALAMWSFRQHMKLIRWAAVLSYIALDLIMQAPAYYILARIDIVGGSTSWHRAALIEAAIANLRDWWFVGTTHTRHWISYGVPWSPDHADITNYYVWMGVCGGLPLMFLFIGLLWRAFTLVGKKLRQPATNDEVLPHPFFVWALGSSLFAHAATFISVSYFDQSVVFLYLTLAAIGSACLPASLGDAANTSSNFTASVR